MGLGEQVDYYNVCASPSRIMHEKSVAYMSDSKGNKLIPVRPCAP